jgi:uncharacterized protein YdhG (YjbR/CyaY superfamily)
MQQTENIDSFIAQFPDDIQAVLQELRALIHREAPGCSEAIKYGIPTFVLNGNLVHFAAYKTHIGFIPAIRELKNSHQNFRNTSSRKERFSFHWGSRFRLI